MDIDKIKMLLLEIRHISDSYEKMAQLSGENFNIFKILNLESDEVRMHSAILAELLNPQGSHGQNDLFLDLFVKQLGINDFNTKSAYIETEKNIGPVNSDYTKGGRIDILLTDKFKKHIIIENKIYANDQKNQLVRYYNFDKKASLFYLNLDGKEPTNFSTEKKINPEIISYRYDIIEWLEKCKKEAVSLPIIRETIIQYINLLKYLTNQTSIVKMEDEIKKLIESNPNYIYSIELCSQVLQSIVVNTKVKFENLFNEMFPEVTIPLDKELSIKIFWLQDVDGVSFVYQANNNSNSETVLKYQALLKEIYSECNSNSSTFGWFNPKPFERGQSFEAFDKKEIIKMDTDNSYLKKFIEGLIKQENEIRDEFIKRIGTLDNK